MTLGSCEFESLTFDQKLRSFVGSRPEAVETSRLITDTRPRTPSPPPDFTPPRDQTPEPVADLSSEHRHWIFSTIIQGLAQRKTIPFYIKHTHNTGDSTIGEYGGCTARTVPIDRCTSVPRKGEIIVNVLKSNRRKQLSIHPRYLLPWEPIIGSEVVILNGVSLGAVGVVKARQEKYWVVTLTLNDESRDLTFEEKDLATLEDLR